MQVNCAKCSQPIALTDIIESHDGHLSHVDCKHPQVLTPEERALVFLYCSGHVVARCPACDVSFRYNELAADIMGAGRTNMTDRDAYPHGPASFWRKRLVQGAFTHRRTKFKSARLARSA
jgi:hypothetical protein